MRSMSMLKREAQSRPARRRGRLLLVKICLLTLPLFLRGASFAGQTYDQVPGERKIVSRVDPEYPATLKRLYIGGVVRVAVLVAPNGIVKSTELLGGNPILGQSTMKAIKQWKYAPASTDETLTVKVEFDSHR
jgi:TonB family protein